MGVMRSELCDLLGIDVRIVLAPFGPWDEVALAAAVGQHRRAGQPRCRAMQQILWPSCGSNGSG